MDEPEYVYRCMNCSKKKEYREGEAVPSCCDQPMLLEKLPQCTSAPHPEMARNTDSDEPCDDGRSGT